MSYIEYENEIFNQSGVEQHYPHSYVLIANVKTGWNVLGESNAELGKVFARRGESVSNDNKMVLEVLQQGCHIWTLITHRIERAPVHLTNVE